MRRKMSARKLEYIIVIMFSLVGNFFRKSLGTCI